MKISSSRDFRVAVLLAEGALRGGSYISVVSFSAGIEFYHPRNSADIDIAINKIINNRSGYLTFEATQKSRVCKNFDLRQKLKKYKPSLRNQIREGNRIRKQQEDAPAQGAESLALGGAA
ncbi:hypothetical protein AB4189_05440 [Vibrio sp. 10N.286.49.E1]|uniref:hypothetical protein n=1 Tax=Vibrio sp. 10N.286.49.E1 TaxID=3229702 RepID=UPI0035515EBC